MKPLLLIVVLILLVGAGWWLSGGGGASSEQVAVGVEGEPRDVVVDFYLEWLDAVKSTTTDPYQAGLAEAEFLAAGVRSTLAAAQEEGGVDLVLCQEVTPDQVAVREIYINDTEAKFLMLGRGPEREKMAGQATVTLAGSDGAWTIEDIECGAGETAPEREFSFEREGFLLKDSLPESFDTTSWHLVFEQDGQSGYTVPLFFSEASNCGTADDPVTCDEGQFSEATKAVVKGDMTEAGLNVLWFEEVFE